MLYLKVVMIYPIVIGDNDHSPLRRRRILGVVKSKCVLIWVLTARCNSQYSEYFLYQWSHFQALVVSAITLMSHDHITDTNAEHTCHEIYSSYTDLYLTTVVY